MDNSRRELIMNENKTTDLHILQRMNKIPGGMLVVALVISLLVNNLFPGVFRIGGITQALFVEGGNALMGVFLICCGASLNIRQMGMPLYKGFILTAIKFFVGLGIGVLIGAIFGPAGVWGITPMVAIAALTNSNSSLYAILSGKYGDASDSAGCHRICFHQCKVCDLRAASAADRYPLGKL